MNYLSLKLLVTLSSCASYSGVISLGNGKFIISKQAATDFSGVGSIRIEALNEASEACQESGRAVEIESQEETKPPFLLGNYPRVEIVFMCVEDAGN